MKSYLTHLSTTRRDRTVVNTAAAFQNFKRFAKARLRLDELTETMLEEFYLWLRQPTGRHGKPRSLDTAKKNVGYIENFWAWCARKDQFAKHTPAPRELDGLPSDPRQPVRAPTWAEMDAVVAAAGSWYPIVCGVMRAFGLRVSQAMLLKVGDIDTAGTLRVRGELGKTAQERRGRLVPIAPAVLPVIAELVKDRAADEWLVRSARLSGDRARAVQTRFVNGAWERAGVDAAIWKSRPDHAFRKGFVSSLRRAGADVDAVEVLVGHSLGLRGEYTDADAQPLVDAVARIPAFSDGAVDAITRAHADAAPVTPSAAGEVA